ncbi:MAG: hypothetical protein Q8N36_02795, partial [bacterium]|nr:hypothetical protein [bacterium]
IAEGQGIPLLSISTLRGLAEQTRQFEGIIIPLLDAQRSQYYGAMYSSHRGELIQLQREQAIDLTELTAWVGERQNVILVGEAAPTVSKMLNQSIYSHLLTPRASILGVLASREPYKLAFKHPANITINYVRPSSAKPKGE